MTEGGRQIMAYLIPGDLFEIQFSLIEKMDHSVGLLSDALVATIPAGEMLELTRRFPNIGRALKWATFVDDSISREWLINVGQRDSLQRLAHLICELCVRLSVVKLVEEPETFVLPLTQAELADTTGITEVHLNRLLIRLRKDGLISLKGRKLTILKFDRLAEIAGFDDSYLHTDGPSVEPKL